MIAAMMTAANLGARVTGWGFVVFTVGSIGWSTVGLTSGQTNLLATNIFLTLVNMVGIWRWLGRQRAYEEGAEAAAEKSETSPQSGLYNAAGLAGLPLMTDEGQKIGNVVDAMIACEDGRVRYFVVATGGVAGIDQEFRALDASAARLGKAELTLDIAHNRFEALPTIAADDWPAEPPEPATPRGE
ncbi:sporulation protein YlmC with PRC-barrel domain [Sphingomonas zeicaulis]|uniref:PRC-barrel domain-containing protein n=1 Tax=Sphingomonas zeicaulis TaxID=1632740 RepID=UPI003D1EC6BC